MSKCHCCTYGHFTWLGIEITFKGKSNAPAPPMLPYPVMLNWVGICTNGGELSRASLVASFPLVWSQKIPYPPRIEVLASPLGSKAKPIRGAALNRCPFIQPTGTPPTPHCTIPLNGSPVPGTIAPAWPVIVPLLSSTCGALAALQAVGS